MKFYHGTMLEASFLLPWHFSWVFGVTCKKLYTEADCRRSLSSGKMD